MSKSEKGDKSKVLSFECLVLSFKLTLQCLVVVCQTNGVIPMR
jgi:hypothetical protein